MSSRWKMSLSTLVIGAAAFLVGPILWPMSPSVPAPPSSLLPGYMRCRWTSRQHNQLLFLR